VVPLTVALPKGRLLPPASELFRQIGCGCSFDDGSRRLLLHDPHSNLRFLLAKAADVPIYVEYGAADLGIVGQDTLRESGRDVYEPLLLNFGHCRLVLAGTPQQRACGIGLNGSVRVATKYPRLAQGYFRQQGLSVETIHLAGSIELAPRVGLADLLVDVVQTGRTLRENGLVEMEVIMECQATVIVNRVSQRLRLAEIRRLLAAMQSSGESLCAQVSP
jgi:ATP phosphoribosyltransferase